MEVPQLSSSFYQEFTKRFITLSGAELKPLSSDDITYFFLPSYDETYPTNKFIANDYVGVLLTEN